MRTLEEHSVTLPPVACADIATVAGQALIYCPDDESEIMVRDYLFTPFGLTATVRFDRGGAIVDKRLSAGSSHDILGAAVEILAERAGIRRDDEDQLDRMAEIFAENLAILDDPVTLRDLADEGVFILVALEQDHDLLGRILDGSITLQEVRTRAIGAADYHNDRLARTSGVVIDDTWSLDEAIADAAQEQEVVLFGVLNDQPFLHTIGLSELDWPELVVRNLDPHLSPFLLRSIIALHEIAGAVPEPGRIPDEIMPGGLRLVLLDRQTVHDEFPRADGGTGTFEVVFPL